METLEKTFSDILRTKHWGTGESRSGYGSTEKATEHLRAGFRCVLELFDIKSILDIPCGDFYWMNLMDLDGAEYIGADIVEELIRSNRTKYNRDFRRLDIISSPLPQVDLIICRDCFGHLSLRNCLESIDNIKKSKSRYLLITTFLRRENRDIQDGRWTTRNMMVGPFGFPIPLVILDELCTESYPLFNDKSLGLWRISDL